MICKCGVAKISAFNLTANFDRLLSKPTALLELIASRSILTTSGVFNYREVLLINYYNNPLYFYKYLNDIKVISLIAKAMSSILVSQAAHFFQ